MSEDEQQDDAPHELFLPEGVDDQIVRPVWITVKRERPIEDTAGRSLKPDELPNVDAIRRKWGGGVYQVWARDAQKRPITCRRVTIAGPPRPGAMVDHTNEDENAASDQFFAPAPAPAAPAPVAAPGEASVVAEMLRAFRDEAKESRAEATKANERMVTAITESNKSVTTTAVEAMKTVMQVKIDAQAATSTPALDVNAVVEGALKREKEAVDRGMEIAQKIAEATGDGDDVEGTIGQIIGGMDTWVKVSEERRRRREEKKAEEAARGQQNGAKS